MRAHRIRKAVVLSLIFLAGLAPAHADEVGAPWPEDALPTDALLSGEEIYRRVLRNRLSSYEKDARVISGDRSGAEQESSLTIHYQNYDEVEEEKEPGVHSKTRLEYTEPFDLRYTAYLVIDKQDAVNDQFVYLPTYRRIRRVNLRGEAVFGSDFSFEDVLPRELEDAEYKRLADDNVDGVACFVVEATPNPTANSEYSKFVFRVEKDRYVPLTIRYSNEAGVFFKELKADYDSIQLFDTAWIPTRSTMRNLLAESWSKLVVTKLIPNPSLPRSTFSVRNLERR